MKITVVGYLLVSICISSCTKYIEPESTRTNARSISRFSKATFIDPSLTVADSFLRVGVYDSAIRHYKEVSKVFSAKKIWPGYIKSIYKMAISFRRKGCSNCKDSSRLYLERALREAEELLGKNDPEVAAAHYYLGEHYQNENSSLSLEHYEKNAAMIQDYFRHEPNFIAANTFLVIGEQYYYQLGNYNLAEVYYKKCVAHIEAIVDSLKDGNYELAKSYLLIVKSSRAKGDYLKAVQYGEMALRLATGLQRTRASFIANCHVTLANAYFSLKNYSRARDLYNSGIKIMSMSNPNSPLLVNYFNNVAACLIQLNQQQRAAQYLNKAIALNNGADLSDLSVSYFNLSEVYKNNPQLSLSYLNKNLHTVRQLYQGKHHDIAFAHNAIGSIYLKERSLDKALNSFQSALIELVDQFNNKDISSSPRLENLFNSQLLTEILENKGNAFFLRYKQDTTHLGFLELSLENYLLSAGAMHINRSTYEQNESKLLLQTTYRRTFETALGIASILEKKKPGMFVSAALHLIERSKSTLLSDLIDKRHAIELLKLSPADQDLEKQLIDQVTNSRLELTKTKDGKSSYLDSVIFLQEKEIDNFYSKHGMINNALRDSSLMNSISSLSQVKKLLGSQNGIIDFFFGDTAIYVLYISSRGEIYHKVRITETLRQKMKQFNTLASELRMDSIAEDCRKFKDVSYELYSLFIKPGEALFSDGMQITIIPDGPLTLLPFEALTTGETTQDKNYYRNLPYFLIKNPIGYSASLALHFENLKDMSREISRFAAFETINSSPEIKSKLAGISDTYLTLSDCNESNLKKALPSHDGFHLTVHGKGSQASIAGSFFILNNDVKSNEDDTLYAEEVYSHNLSEVQLFVLNSCETGTGKYYQGEGVFSMARALTISGAKTVLYSLWEIPANSSSKIISQFYDKVSDYKTLNASLQESKIEFIRKQQDDILAHPMFWSGLVIQGNTYPIMLRKKTSSLWIVITLVGVAVIGLSSFLYLKESRAKVL